MRMTLVRNYWLLIAAWCMVLNDNLIMSLVLSLTACIMLTIKLKGIMNYWRMLTISLMTYGAILNIIYGSNIIYYFNRLPIFLAAVSLNVGIIYEMLLKIKAKYIYPFLLFMLISVVVLSTVIFILPNRLYSMFTKDSLYLMEILIFAPSILEICHCLVYKKIRNIAYKKNRKYEYILETIKKSS